MLTACAGSPNKPAASASSDLGPDPVIASRTVTRLVCPAELALPLDPRPLPAVDARLEGNEPGMAWLRAVLSRLGLIEDRLADAAAECAKDAPAP